MGKDEKKKKSGEILRVKGRKSRVEEDSLSLSLSIMYIYIRPMKEEEEE